MNLDLLTAYLLIGAVLAVVSPFLWRSFAKEELPFGVVVIIGFCWAPLGALMAAHYLWRKAIRLIIALDKNN